MPLLFIENRKLKIFLVLFIAACLASALSPASALAVGNLKVGPFAVHPLLLSLGAIYSDNLFRTNANEEKDTGFLIIPGISFETDRDDRKLFLKYEIPVEQWLKFDSQNAVGHNVEAAAHFDLASGWMIEVDEKYVYSHDDQGANIGILLDFFKENTVHAGLGYEFADLYRVRGDFYYGLQDYRGAANDFRDFTSYTYSGTVFYQVLPKTSALFEVTYLNTRFDKTGVLDSDELNLLLGLTWDMTGKSTGTAKFGYGMKDFDAPALEDFGGFIMSIELEHSMDDWTSFTIEAVRRVDETNMLGANYYTITGFSGMAKHMLTEKIGFAVKVSYGQEEYSTPVTISGVTDIRKDNTWRSGVEATYDIQEWLGVKGNYEFGNRSSTFHELDYTENRFMFQIFTVL